MIKLFEFVKKAALRSINESEASEQAKLMGLRSVGWGRWADKTGRVVAKTVDGTLVKVDTPDDPGDADDPNMMHINPYDSELGGRIGSEFEYEPGKGLRQGGKPAPAHKIPFKMAGNYHSGKGFYEPREPLEDFSQWENRKDAVHSFIQKNGGVNRTIQTVSAAVNATRNSGDDTEKWKALQIAKSVRDSMVHVASDYGKELEPKLESLEPVMEGSETFDQIHRLVNFNDSLEKMAKNIEAPMISRPSLYSPAEYADPLDYLDVDETRRAELLEMSREVLSKVEQLADDPDELDEYLGAGDGADVAGAIDEFFDDMRQSLNRVNDEPDGDY
jgi:hypothetical protein